MTPHSNPLLEEESEILADFAMEAYDIVKTARWRKHGYSSLTAFVKKYTSMTLPRFRDIAEAGGLTDSLGITRDDLARTGVERIIRALPAIRALLKDNRRDDARAWYMELEHRTIDEITARNAVLAPVRNTPSAVLPCPHCGFATEVFIRGRTIKLRPFEE